MCKKLNMVCQQAHKSASEDQHRMVSEEISSNSTVNVDFYFLEGLAMSHMLLEVSAIECERGKGYRIVAVDKGGRRLLTPCADKRAVDKILLTLRLYMKWSENIVKSGMQP